MSFCAWPHLASNMFFSVFLRYPGAKGAPHFMCAKTRGEISLDCVFCSFRVSGYFSYLSWVNYKVYLFWDIFFYTDSNVSVKNGR